MGYHEDDSMVRVDFFKPSGKWYTTEAVRWTGSYDGEIHVAFERSLLKHFGGEVRMSGMTAICLEPYHKHAHPISLIVNED